MTNSIKSPKVKEDTIALEEQTAQSSNLNAEQNNLAQIRDILFGEQDRAYTDRFATLEAELQQRATELQNSIENRFTEMETLVKSNMNELSNRLVTEQQERNNSLDNLSDELSSLSRTIEDKLNHLDDQLHVFDSALRKSLLEESQKLSAALEQQVAGLNSAKTDRTSLAKMFSELASRLEQGAEKADS